MAGHSLTAFFYLLWITLARAEIVYSDSRVELRINDQDDYSLPILPDMKTRVEFPMKNIEKVEMEVSNESVYCIF